MSIDEILDFLGRWQPSMTVGDLREGMQQVADSPGMATMPEARAPMLTRIKFLSHYRADLTVGELREIIAELRHDIPYLTQQS